ncbi:hypothetical protein [Micromonospora sp. LOL_023]|uniref:hypothetical protein n=1 Tax=Micromonospora sp. LOL_023 TaxID=3345418 RepID=UPI003A88528B
MPVLLSTVATTVLPSYKIFCLRSCGATDPQDLIKAGQLARADGIGFTSSAIGVQVATEVSLAIVLVEVWTKKPFIMPDQRSFDFAAEGLIYFPGTCWSIDESFDSEVMVGIKLPSGAGRYGARVAAYNYNTFLGRYEALHIGENEEYLKELTQLKRIDRETTEQYRIQLWPAGRK